MGISHGRALYCVQQSALTRVHPNNYRLVAAVGYYESHYGHSWGARWVNNAKGESMGVSVTHNIGCIQAHGRPNAYWAGHWFTGKDTAPTSDGKSTPYSARFRAYSKELDGWGDLILHLTRGKAGVVMLDPDATPRQLSEAMYADRYYEGFGATVSERIHNHDAALRGSLTLIDVVVKDIRSRIMDFQRFTGAKVDSIVGPETIGKLGRRGVALEDLLCAQFNPNVFK